MMRVITNLVLLASIFTIAYGCTLGTITGCSTSPTAGITSQIVAQLNSMGYSFRTMNADKVKCSGCVLQSSAASALEAAATAKNDYITLNSAFRSSAQQYVLYSWYQKGKCDISLAAEPGQSNHEGGRAIDTSYYSYWQSTLESKGFQHTYPSTDPVHFDYLAAPNIAKQNLLAFQKLYNKYNPTKKIAEDGIYGPNTANALYNTPCAGW